MKEKIRKKSAQKITDKETSTGQVPIRFLLEHLNCPISIFDFRKRKFIYVNQPFTQITGLDEEECYKMGLDEFLSRVESFDLLSLQGEMKKRLASVTGKFIDDRDRQLSYSMNCRFKQKDGTFSDIMVQCTVIEWDENNYPAVTMNLYTDLTHHKKDLKVVFTISIFNEALKQWKTVLTEEFLRIPVMLSTREHEVMKMIAKDIGAEEISEKLGLKFYTVRAHWRNILSKTGCKSQKELKQMAQQEGWV